MPGRSTVPAPRSLDRSKRRSESLFPHSTPYIGASGRTVSWLQPSFGAVPSTPSRSRGPRAVVDQSRRQPDASESCVDAFRDVLRGIPHRYDPALARRAEEPVEARGVHLTHGIPHDSDLLNPRQKRSGGAIGGLYQRLDVLGEAIYADVFMAGNYPWTGWADDWTTLPDNDSGGTCGGWTNVTTGDASFALPDLTFGANEMCGSYSFILCAQQ